MTKSESSSWLCAGRARFEFIKRARTPGTFSIGKTWNLDELTAIQSYTAFMPGNQQEAFEKSWAGNTGFIVSLGKPYYWQAPTSKEKDFYIASLIKIFRKYTGGKLPQLIGFPAGISRCWDLLHQCQKDDRHQS